LVFGLSLQLILQVLGIYEVDYGMETENLRRHTSAGDSNFSGFLLALFSFVLLKLNNDGTKYSVVLLFFMALIGILITQSRGALLLFIPSVLLFFRGLNTKYSIIVLVLILCVLFTNVYTLMGDSVFSRFNGFTENSDFEELSSGRAERIRLVFESSSDYLTFLGTQKNVVPLHFQNDITPLYSPHNFYLGVILHFGITGFFFIWVYLKLNLRCWKFISFESRLFLLLYLFLILNIELYSINAYVLYLSCIVFFTFKHEKANLNSG
jgi:hypothetical protein